MRFLVVQESDWIERGPHQSHHLMERLSARGHEIRVIDFEISWRDRPITNVLSRRTVFSYVRKATDNGSVTVIRPAFIKLPLLDYISLIITHFLEIRRQMREFKPDVVVGFGVLNSLIASRLASRNGTPFFYYLIDELHLLVPQRCFRGLARFIESCSMGHADAILSINEGLRQYTVELGAPLHKTRVIRAGIDKKRFDPMIDGRALRSRLGFAEDKVVLFFMGWLYEFSGLKEVASALLDCKEGYSRFRLLILGKGELRNELLEMANRSQLLNIITLVDWVPYEEVPGYIAAADICILPAHNNDVMRRIVPIKLYEYLAMGKPVISTRLEGISKEFGHDAGIVYVDSPEGVLPSAMNLIEKERRNLEGNKGLRFTGKFDWETITEEFEALAAQRCEQIKKSYLYPRPRDGYTECGRH